MSRPIDPSRDPSSRRAGRVRMLLAGLLTAAMAIAGLAFASPAAAKTAPAQVEVNAITCSSGDDGTAVLRFIGITQGDDWTVAGGEYSVSGVVINDVDVPLEGLAPGQYSITIMFAGSPDLWGQFTIEACPPDVDVAVAPLACSTDGDGEALLTLSGLVPEESYRYSVTGPGFDVEGLLDEFGPTEEIELIGMPPGNYVAYAEQITEPRDPPNFDWIGFAIEPCQPEVAVEVTECVASGGTGAAVVTLSNLVAGVEYRVRVTDHAAPDGTPYGDVLIVMGEAVGTTTVEASGLPAGHQYTVWVDGVWAAEPWEEPPYVGGGGNFTPITTVELASSADFNLQPCPASPVAPAAPAKAAVLPATGTDDTGGLLVGAMLALILGGAALIVARRRQGEVPEQGCSPTT